MVDSPLSHLDRPFDYAVPQDLDAAVRPGTRVRVRFAGRLVDAWVLDRIEISEHHGQLSVIERVVGGEPVLTAQTSRLFRAVADRWAGTFADVVRLGVPSRHAQAEAVPGPEATGEVTAPDPAGWARYRAGGAFLGAVGEGRAARAVWNAMPGPEWPDRLAELVQACLAGGRGAIVVAPDARDAARVDAALAAALPSGSHVWLSAELGPRRRYRHWLTVRRGQVKAVLGPRSAVYAPVDELGLIVVWDDGDDLLAEPRAPYPHARDVAVLRSSQQGCSLLVGGLARTAESALLVESGWAHEIVGPRSLVRLSAARIRAAGDDLEAGRDPAARSARLPALAFATARRALADDLPVLIQVPRRGYQSALSCARDRTPARCPTCQGPLAATAAATLPTCRWCGRTAGWTCPVCGSSRLRAAVTGADRTAEEIGRAFPSVPIRTSSADSVLASVPTGRSIVVATPGAEPVAAAGYGAALLLDGWAMLARADLRAAEETLRRWFNAAALVRASGTVVVGAETELPAVQALIRWDPAGFAIRELADRRQLGFPPVSRMASLTGIMADVAGLLALARLPDGCEELGSVPVPPPGRAEAQTAGRDAREQVRTLLRVPRRDGVALAEALHSATAIRSARKLGGPVRVQLDPLELF
jgi:primosomal protein N' (replication factor Y)